MLMRLLGSVLVLLAFAPSGGAAAPLELEGTTWEFIEFRSSSDTVGVVRNDQPGRFRLVLSGDGTVAMELGCNRARGRWSAEASGDRRSGPFRFGPLASTKALCLPPNLDQRIIRDAQYVRSYLLEGDRLFLSLMADGGIFVWERRAASTLGRPAEPAAAPEDGGPRNWRVVTDGGVLNLRDRPSTDGAIQARYRIGTILDNLGCERADGRVWCDVQELGGGPRGYVAGEYLQPAISPDGTAAFGPDDSALRIGQGAFDAQGMVPCRGRLGQPTTQCPFKVARSGGGYATVLIEVPWGSPRLIYFRMGRAIGAGYSEAEPTGPFKAETEADLTIVRLGAERYEIPAAVVLGG